MSRDAELRVYDMVEACTRIDRYVRGIAPSDFATDDLRLDAVVRNLEILGEAARHVPEDVRALEPDVPWHEIAGIRNILIHAYFRVDTHIVVDVAYRRLPDVQPMLARLLATLHRRT